MLNVEEDFASRRRGTVQKYDEAGRRQEILASISDMVIEVLRWRAHCSAMKSMEKFGDEKSQIQKLFQSM